MLYNFLLSIGFARITLLVILLTFINNKITNKTIFNKPFENYIFILITYGSCLVIINYILTLLNLYDSISAYLTLSTLFFLHYFKQKKGRQFLSVLRQEKELIILRLLKELNHYSKINLNCRISTPILQSFLVILIISLAVITSRFYLIEYDLYLLSDFWLSDLNAIKSMNFNSLYNDSLSINGELTLINFYQKLTGISSELALQSFGVIETIFLALIIFWVTSKLNDTNKILALIASLIFIFYINIIPININYVFEHKSIFLSLCFALPTIPYIVNPHFKTSRLFGFNFDLTLIFAAITLINLFTAVILVPILLLCLILFTPKIYNHAKYQSIRAYLLGTTIILCLHYIMCVIKQTNFLTFLQNNIIDVSIYTDSPLLLLSYKKMKIIFFTFTTLNLTILITLKRYLRKAFYLQFIFSSCTCLLILLTYIDSYWWDKDLLNQSLCVFIPIIIALLAGNFGILSKKVFKFKNKKLIPTLFMSFSFYFFYYNHSQFTENNIQKIDSEKQLILKTYEKIFDTYLPFSYAIVNNDYGKPLSRNSHYFIPHEYFTNDYNEQESIYHQHLSDKKFFDENPEYVLPKTILVFILKSKHTRYNTPNAIVEQIEKLVCKRRTVNLFMEDGPLKVYEIVNTPDSSKILDLIF